MQTARIGTVLARRYRLISQLGSGATASVYLARHVVIDRLCAIKVYHPEGAHPSQRERLLREARAVNRIHHPNIVEITDHGETDDAVYLVMEYVPGEPLSRALERGPLPWRAAARIGVQIASALERAHEMGVIHRDLKPSNVLLLSRRDGEHLVKLTDFGVAKIVDEPRLTETQTLVGTPGYMAPEHQLFGRFDARSDLYALGVLLFEATTRRLPIEPREGHPAWAEQLLAPPPGPRTFAPDIDPFFDDVVCTLLAPDPDDRPRDAFEASDLLERALSRTPRVSSLPPPSQSAAEPAWTSDRPPEPPLPPSDAQSRRPGPHLITAPHGRLLPICMTALERITLAAKAAPPSPEMARALAHAEKQVTLVARIARMVEADAQEDNALRAEARALHADLGRKLDDVARERSKLLGWAGTVAERAYQVEARLSLGEDPIPTMEAMVWERAALEAAEAEAHERAAELAADIERIQSDLKARTDRIEAALAAITARLWGRVGALRAMALEAWMDLEAAARAASVPVEALSDG